MVIDRVNSFISEVHLDQLKWIHGLLVLVWQTTDRSVLHYLLYLVCRMQNNKM